MLIISDTDQTVTREEFMLYLYYHAMSFLAGRITLQRLTIAINVGREMSFSPIWQDAFTHWEEQAKGIMSGNTNELTAIGHALIRFNVAFGRIRKGRHG